MSCWPPGATLRIDVELELGTTQQTVMVNANVQMLQNESARVAVGSKLVDELPLVVGGTMRGVFDLALITGDVGGTDINNLRIGGGHPGRFAMTLDGISALTGYDTQDSDHTSINTPSVDAITEFARGCVAVPGWA